MPCDASRQYILDTDVQVFGYLVSSRQSFSVSRLLFRLFRKPKMPIEVENDELVESPPSYEDL